MINIISSRYPQANSLYIYKKIEEDLREGRKSFLIVPEQFTLESDMELMDHLSTPSIMDCKVLSFTSFSSYILDRLEKAPKEGLSANGKIMLLTNIMDDLNDDLSIYKNNYQNVDFIKNFSSMISTIKVNKFGQDFFEEIEGNPNINEDLKEKFREIRLVYKAYQERVGEDFSDGEDRLDFVVENLSSCEFLRGASFYFDKFDQISELRMGLIEEVLALNCQVFVSLTLDRGKVFTQDIYDRALYFHKKLEELGEIRELNPLEESSYGVTEDISRLLENYEDINSKKYPKTPSNIHILESVSTTREVENMAVIIKKLIKEEDLRYRDFSVYLSDQEEYENDLVRVFDREGLPYFLDKTGKLSDNHIVKAYLAALRLALYNFRADDLSFFLRSGIFHPGKGSLSKIISFQNYCRQRKIHGGMIFQDKYFMLDEDFYKDQPGELSRKKMEIEEVASIRNSLLDLLSPLYELRRGQYPAEKICGEIYRLIDRPELRKGFENYQEELKERNLAGAYEENAQVRDKFIGILDQEVSLMAERPISLSKAYKLIEAGCQNLRLGVIPPYKDQVMVSPFSRGRVSERKVKIFLGLNDLYFPGKASEDLLVSDREKKALSGENLDLKLYITDRDKEDRFSLYKMFTSGEKFYLSFALANKKGEALKKSSVLINIEEIFPKLEPVDLTGEDLPDYEYSENLTEKRVLSILYQLKRGGALDGEDRVKAKSFLKYLEAEDGKAFEDLKKGLFFTNQKPPLSSSETLYAKKDFSVSEIDNFARCPYRHFIDYGLRLKGEDDFEVGNFEVGNIIHSNMEGLARDLADLGPENLTEENIEELIDRNFKKALEENIDKTRLSDPKNLFTIKNIEKTGRTNSLEMIEQIRGGDFHIEAMEETFDRGEDYTFKEVNLPDGSYIHGRIDRVDRYENFLRVIDYKTGNKVFKLVNILNGIDLQLIVYMISLEETDPSLTPVASLYMPLKDELVNLGDLEYKEENIEDIYREKFKLNGLIVEVNDQVLPLMDREGYESGKYKLISDKKENIIGKEDLKKLTAYVKGLLASYIEEIKGGNISLNPLRYSSTSSECDRCSYRGICKFDPTIDQKRFRDFDKGLSLEDIEEED